VARGNSALKAKLPKVVAGNRQRAQDVLLRVEGGQREVLEDLGLSTWATIPSTALPPTLDIVEDGGLGKWTPEGEDEAAQLAFVINVMGITYSMLLDPPPGVADLIDPVVWTRKAVENIVRAAGNSPRCAYIYGAKVDGTDLDPVCVVDYKGPARSVGDTKVTVFYPNICKMADPRARLTAEPNMAPEWISSIDPKAAMRWGINSILLRTRKDLVYDTLNTKEGQTVKLPWEPEYTLPDLVDRDNTKGGCPECGARGHTWADDCLVLQEDGTSFKLPAHPGKRETKGLIRTREVETLESGSKKLMRAAEDDALSLLHMAELLEYVREHDTPYRKSDAGKVTKVAAFLLFLNREDSLREVKEYTEADGAQWLEGTAELAKARMLDLAEVDPEAMQKRMYRLTHSSTGVGRKLGRLSPGAIASEWQDIVPFSIDPGMIKRAQALLNEATDWYWWQYQEDEVCESWER
jgi:hypothetical protein